MITKKDSKAIAEIIKAGVDMTIIHSTTEPNTTIKSNIAKKLADYFEQENPNFDCEQFMGACGL
ncbi:hypothetical protein LCGC14_0929090 [marine sediment metagenome]|uniref:Uncharacterized protein n=1 Tax=marine sediment metagenome TaxID=412755 RepID=A0A0F9RV46_9ZZZZ